MIYIFGQGNNLRVITNVNDLTLQEIEEAFVVELLPPIEVPDGHYFNLVLENEQLFWEYLPIIDIDDEDLLI